MAGLKKIGYASVINLRVASEPGANVDGEAAAAKAAGINFVHLPLTLHRPIRICSVIVSSEDGEGPLARATTGQPWMVPPVGWLHGIAFVVYVAMMIATFRNRQIGARGWLRTFIASLVPLGTFANDQWLKRLAEKRT